MNPIQEMPTQAAVDSNAGTTCVGTLDDKEAQRKAKSRAATAKWYANPENKAKRKAYDAIRRATPENKKRKRASAAKWYADPENKAKQKAYDAKRRANPENKAKQKAYDAKRRANPKYKAKQKAYMGTWCASPASEAKRKAKSTAYSASYRANPENKEKLKASYARWRATPHARAGKIAKEHARRAQKLRATIGDLMVIATWEKRWRTAKEVICYWCRTRVEGNLAHADHIQPLAKGGAHSIENLCTSCPSCNNRKHAKDITEWNAKLLEPVLL